MMRYSSMRLLKQDQLRIVDRAVEVDVDRERTLAPDRDLDNHRAVVCDRHGGRAILQHAVDIDSDLIQAAFARKIDLDGLLDSLLLIKHHLFLLRSFLFLHSY